MGDFINFLGNNLADFWTYTGFANATGGHVVMLLIGPVSYTHLIRINAPCLHLLQHFFAMHMASAAVGVRNHHNFLHSQLKNSHEQTTNHTTEKMCIRDRLKALAIALLCFFPIYGLNNMLPLSLIHIFCIGIFLLRKRWRPPPRKWYSNISGVYLIRTIKLNIWSAWLKCW